MTEERNHQQESVDYNDVFGQPNPDFINGDWGEIEKWVRTMQLTEEEKQEYLDYIYEERQKFEED